MVHLKGLSKLTSLNLNATRVGDRGLAQLDAVDRPPADHLLDDKNVTDDGIGHLKQMKQLNQVEADRHRRSIPSKSVEDLRTALKGNDPDVTWVQPYLADRKAAEWVLSIGGSVSIASGNGSMSVTAVKNLPQDIGPVISGFLGGNQQVTDTALEIDSKTCPNSGTWSCKKRR